MRILLTCHRYPPDGAGGVERIVQGLSHELPRLGDDVAVVTRRSRENTEPALLREQLGLRSTLYRMTGTSGNMTSILRDHALLEELFLRVLAEFNPDVLHCLHLLNLSPSFLEIAAQHRIPIVISLQDFYFACPLVHLKKSSGESCGGARGGQECADHCFASEAEDAPTRWTLRALYFRRLLDLAERVVCPSQHVMEFFVEQVGLRSEQLCIVANGIVPAARPAVLKPWPRERGFLHLVFLGAMAPHKGVHRLLEALELADLPSVRLDINGTTHDYPEFVEQVRHRAFRLAGVDVRFNGRYEVNQLPRLLEDADCVVVPSQVPETFGLVCAEALAYGVPILVSRIGALPEAVQAGVNGLILDFDQPFELAEHLRALWNDEALYQRLRRGAAETRVMLTDEHAKLMRGVYEDAQSRALRRRDKRAGLRNELTAVRTLILQNGFD